jgi:hypothetical protein
VRRRCGRGGLRFVAVPALDLLAAARILGGVGLRLLDHPNDFLTAQAGRRDRDLLLPSRRRILRGNVEDAVGIDVERHLDLRSAARGGRNAFEAEPPERAIVARQAPFSLQHVDVDRRQVVCGAAERFGLLCGNRAVAWNQHGHHASLGLDAQRQRRHVEEDDSLDVATEHRTLNRRAGGDDFVRIHALRGSRPKSCVTRSCTFGMRVWPPTKTTS